MNLHHKILLAIAGLYGAVSVAVAAVGALALAAISALQLNTANSKFSFSGYLIALGTLLFSGSLLVSVASKNYAL